MGFKLVILSFSSFSFCHFTNKLWWSTVLFPSTHCTPYLQFPFLPSFSPNPPKKTPIKSHTPLLLVSISQICSQSIKQLIIISGRLLTLTRNSRKMVTLMTKTMAMNTLLYPLYGHPHDDYLKKNEEKYFVEKLPFGE